jgi:uncharacterized protein
MSIQEEAIEMYVIGPVYDPNTQAPVIILKDETGEINLPIWIGVPEATSIASTLKHLTLPRPLTHDLLFNFLNQLNVQVEHLIITDLKDGTYVSEITCSRGQESITLDCRPSDGINIALRASAPIYVTKKVIDLARTFGGLASSVSDDLATRANENTEQSEGLTTGQTTSDSLDDPDADKPLDFKHIDKQQWDELLEKLSPEDFKYKM